MKPDSTANEIYKVLEDYGVPPNRTFDCAHRLINPYSVLLDYAVKIGYRVGDGDGN